jgi:hypothetical protein
MEALSFINECKKNENLNTGLLLSKLYNLDSETVFFLNKKKTITPSKNKTTIKVICNWTSSFNLVQQWKKMSKDSDGNWDDIQITWNDNPSPDFYVIVNAPYKNEFFIPSKTIIFHMEPNMDNESVWKDWSTPKLDKHKFLKIIDHSTGHNNSEWHLSKTYSDLIHRHPLEKTKDLSTIVSGKYTDLGHIKRVDFIKYLEEKNIQIDVYGDNRWKYKDYKGKLPVFEKDNGLFEYKYHFNAENTEKNNYFTEKIIDAILSESLCFYWGCPNLSEYIPKESYVRLDLCSFESDAEKIKKTIENNTWEEKLPYIKQAKEKILNTLNFFPRLKHIIDSLPTSSSSSLT